MSNELKLHLVINGVTLDAVRTSRITRCADPTEIVRWTGTFRGHPFILEDFQGVLTDGIDPNWRGTADARGTPPWEEDSRTRLFKVLENLAEVAHLEHDWAPDTSQNGG